MINIIVGTCINTDSIITNDIIIDSIIVCKIRTMTYHNVLLTVNENTAFLLEVRKNEDNERDNDETMFTNNGFFPQNHDRLRLKYYECSG